MSHLYLHVGSNKTATTTLQYRLARSPEALAAAAVLYPVAGQSPVGAHHVLAGHLCSRPPGLFRPEGQLESLLAQLRDEVTASPAAPETLRVVISSEMLFWLRRNIVAALEALFSEFSSVKLIVYLRRQDTYLPSFYSSVVSNGNCPPPFETFCANQDLDYLANLDAWAELIGVENVIARPFMPACWTGGDIVTDFLAQVGCELSSADLVDSEPKNEALSAESIEVLRAIGGAASITRFAAFRDFLEGHFAALRATPSKRLMSQPLLESLRERYDAGNRALGRRYFASADADALAFPSDLDAATDPREPLAPADYGALVTALWDKSQQLQTRLADSDAQLAEARAQLALAEQRLADQEASTGVLEGRGHDAPEAR